MSRGSLRAWPLTVSATADRVHRSVQRKSRLLRSGGYRVCRGYRVYRGPPVTDRYRVSSYFPPYQGGIEGGCAEPGEPPPAFAW